MRWLESITDSLDLNLSKLQEIVEDRGAWHATVCGISKSQTDLAIEKKSKLLMFAKLSASYSAFLPSLPILHFTDRTV